MKNSQVFTEKEAFVIFKKPFESELFFLKGNWSPISLNEIEDQSGFLISNFDKSLVYILQGQPTQLNDFSININSTIPFVEENKTDYLAKAESFISECNSSSKIEKIVLSRTFSTKNTQPIDYWFKQLNQKYENTFNCIFNHPHLGCWISATPEILISKSNNRYKTVSLAGTLPNNENSHWQNKELIEQQFVTDYLLNKITSIGEITKDKITQETIVNGKVKHLKTTIPFQSSKNTGEIINLLHPTPAVCGTPQQDALHFIQDNEGYQRNLYTGIIGYYTPNQADIFVNLRCARISNDRINCYVGGGITKDSNKEKEWEETVLKSQTLLQFL